MNDMAIKFQREEQQNGFFVFKPICILVGKYNEEDDTFITTDNAVYNSVTTNIQNITEYFGACYTPEGLKKYILDGGKQYEESKREEYFTDVFNTVSQFLLVGSVTEDGKHVRIDPIVPTTLKSTKQVTFSLRELQSVLVNSIIGEDKAVFEFSTAMFKNFLTVNPALRKHILLTGPTGTGKTTMVKKTCDYLRIPYYNPSVVRVDDEHLMPANVEHYIRGLINAHSGSIESAQKGVIHITDLQSKLDFFHAEFLEEPLIKLMSGEKIAVRGLDEYFDTSRLTVIIEGNFDKDISYDEGLGFNSQSDNDDFMGNYIYKKAGLMESMLDNTLVVATDELDLIDFMNILRYSSLSPILENKRFYDERGTKLECTMGFLYEISKEAYSLKKGAKSLKSLVDKYLLYADDATINSTIKVMRLTRKTVEDPKKFEYYN